MSVQRNTKFWIIGAVAIVVIVAIGIGAYVGRTKTGAPSDAVAQNETTTAVAATDTQIAASTAAAATQASSAVDESKLIEIKTYTRKNCTSTPILVADKLGFYKEEGLKLKFTGELKSTEILPSVLNGNNDFAETHPNALATYVAGGAKIKGVGRSIIEPGPEVDPKFRHMRWFVKPDTGLKTWADLINYKKGEQITQNGLAPNCSTFIATTIFDKFGIGQARLKFVQFDTDQAALQAVEQGSLDLAVVHPPFYKLAEESGLQLIGDSTDSGLGEAAGIYLYYFTDDYIAKNPDTIVKFLKAMLKAQIWSNEHPDEASKITSDFIGVSGNGSHYYSSTTEIPEDQIKPWVDDLVKNGKLTEGQIKLSDILTHEFEQK